MKKAFLIMMTAVLTGCHTIPVDREFPKAIDELMVACPDLALIAPNTTKFSQVLEVVVENYSHYHTCKAKVDAWIDWYNSQKKNYQSVK